MTNNKINNNSNNNNINNNNINNNNNKSLSEKELINFLRRVIDNSDGIYTIVGLSHFKYPKNGEEVNLYGSCFFTWERPDDWRIVAERMKLLSCKNVNIIYVDRDLLNERITFSLNNDNTTSCRIFSMNYSDLFNEDSLKELTNSCGDYVKFVFVIKGLKWNLIKLGFKTFNININSGNNNLKHVLSPQQFFLSKVAMGLYGFDTKVVSDSFSTLARNPALVRSAFNFTDKHHQIFVDAFSSIYKKDDYKTVESNDKTKGYDDKIENSKEGGFSKSYLEPSNNKTTSNIKNFSINQSNIQKRGLHSSTIKKSEIQKSDYFPYLNNLEGIVNDSSKTDLEKQAMFENYLVNFIEKKIEDNQVFVQKYKGYLQRIDKDSVKEGINEAVKTYILYNNNNNNNILKIIEIEDKTKEKEVILNLILISYSIILTYYNKLGYTAIAALIGKTIMERFYISEARNRKNKGKIVYYKDKNENDIYNFDEYLSYKKIDSLTLIKLGDFFISLLSQFPHNLFVRDYIISTKTNKELAKIRINSDFLNSIRDNLIIPPINLPMLCKPVKWSSKSYGGYLKNCELERGIITKSLDNKHETKNRTVLYKAVNTLNSTKFAVNNLLLQYLLNDGKFILDKVKATDELQRTITLNLAESLKNSPFYLTVRSDWRGRLVTESFFLTYQGNDLSTALINFWDGEVLNKDGLYYFYVYGANNHNFNGLAKKSYIERINWVKSNYDKIVKLDRDLILSAENPFTFLSFCLNMKEIDRDSNWIVKSPVFLDATCSGIQHLAALLRDVELGTNVNLVKSSESDIPFDIYSRLLEPINKAINKYGEKNILCSHFTLIKFDRKTIKQSVMTKVYNVSIYGISEQLKNKMENVSYEHVLKLADVIKSNLSKKYKNYYLAPGKKTSVPLSPSDVMKIAQIINNEIFVIYPSLNDIYTYFIEMADITVKLGIPLSWVTPDGMKILQHYLVSNENKTAINLFGKRKTMVLKQITDNLDKSKQVQAFIPNIIHSLDANHLFKVVVSSVKSGYYPIITIHDCFGTHPNKMKILAHRVKSEFALLYSNEDFLKKFNKHIISNLKNNNFKVKLEKKIYYVFFEKNDEWIKLPEIPKLGDLDLNAIKESSYMIT